MKHRGRHRRRRRGRALRASLAGTALALTAAATLISTSQAAGGKTPGGLSSVGSAAELHELRLKESLTDRTALETLTAGMGGRVGVDEVLRSANHTMRDESDCFVTEKGVLPVAPTAARAYCWEAPDAVDDRWRPQSVTTSRDNKVIVSGWTHAGTTAGEEGLARVAFVDASDPSHLKYRWVLLVVPQADGKGLKAVRSRLGGMAWYENKLIVTARNPQNSGYRDDSLFVFDLDRFLRADVTDSDAIGKVDRGFSAHHYRYVLPAVASYSPASGETCDARGNDGVPCLTSVSLDRTSTPPSVVANESFTTGSGTAARVWRYDLDTVSDRAGLLGTTGRQGEVEADEAYETKATGVRGVLSHDGDWYVSQAAAKQGRHGTVWRQDEEHARAATCTNGTSEHQSYACWGLHGGPLSYAPGTSELWTLTAPVPERVLYAVRLSDVESALD
ncbi:hypothetical protein [Streptomyces sp. HM190]|uniref:hypothetical protein n=1 Tax=Streptomyces sp. HM190 TaxID=2695266 RepID=UPI00135A9106|nr:hypothetical protein [Streptomyces sp. HM190]